MAKIMIPESFIVDTFCSGEAFSSGQNHKKSLTPSGWGGSSLPSVRARPKKLISGDCYTIFNLISSELKLISTLYVEFYVGR